MHGRRRGWSGIERGGGVVGEKGRRGVVGEEGRGGVVGWRGGDLSVK